MRQKRTDDLILGVTLAVAGGGSSAIRRTSKSTRPVDVFASFAADP
jgi:ABC-type molybdate transport system substrate-binding protein